VTTPPAIPRSAMCVCEKALVYEHASHVHTLRSASRN
jgi:hypothetical protein